MDQINLKLRNTYSLSLLALSCFTSFNVISAENRALPNNNTQHENPIETLVVTGTRTAKLLSDSPVSVDVIESDKINMLTQGTLAQALEFIPSVVVERSVKDGYTVKMRGYGSKHVAVLINGQSLIAPANGAVDLDQISAHNIERIEIIKGAASVLYGSAAMGGVINIITKKDVAPQTQLRTEIGFNDSEYSDVAENILHTTSLIHQGHTGQWQHQLSLQHIFDSGFDLDTSDVLEDAGELTKNFLKLGGTKNVGAFDIALNYDFLDESKRKITSVVPGQSELIYYISEVSQHQFGANLTAIDNQWHLKSRLIKHDETSGRTNSLRDATITLAQMEAQYSFQHGNIYPKSTDRFGGEFVFGLATHVDQLDQVKPADASIEVNDKSRHSIEGYGQYNLVQSTHQFLIGIRNQYDSDFGDHTALRLSYMTDLDWFDDPITLRTGFGQGYRVPDLKERYYVFDHSNLGYMVLGNEALNPEQSNAYNLGLDWSTSVFKRAADVNLSFEMHRAVTTDLITTVEDQALSEAMDLIISQYKNINEATISGFDLSADINMLHWSTQLHYSYIDAVDEYDQRLEAKPRHQLKAHVAYDFDDYDLRTMFYAVYQADEKTPIGYTSAAVDSFTTYNLTLNQKINKQLKLHFSIQNLTNVHRDNHLLGQAIFDPRPISTRTFRLGLNYQF